MLRVVITGANRGIGLALAKRYRRAGWQVVATARAPEQADELRSLSNVAVYPLDLSDQTSIDGFAADLAALPVDHLVCNAGSMGPRDPAFGQSKLADWSEVLAVNTAAPWLVTERLAGNLEAGEAKRVAVVSSRLGSIEEAALGWPAQYAASKAGVNMVVRQLSLALRDRGIVTFALHPGWVQTEMGGPGASLAPERSANAIFDMMAMSTADMDGGFYNYDGTPLPW